MVNKTVTPENLTNGAALTLVSDTSAIDSAAIDNALLVRTVERQNAAIAAAKWHLRKGLRLGSVALRNAQFELALKALGSLGAS